MCIYNKEKKKEKKKKKKKKKKRLVSFFHQFFFFDDTLTNNNILFVVITIIFEPSNYLQDLMLNILSYARFNDKVFGRFIADWSIKNTNSEATPKRGVVRYLCIAKKKNLNTTKYLI